MIYRDAVGLRRPVSLCICCTDDVGRCADLRGEAAGVQIDFKQGSIYLVFEFDKINLTAFAEADSAAGHTLCLLRYFNTKTIDPKINLEITEKTPQIIQAQISTLQRAKYGS